MSTTVLLSQEQKVQNNTPHVMPSVDMCEIFKCISDDKSLTLFNSVALAQEKSELLISKLGMTRKQFYARIERLSQQGLITRKGGRYNLTTMGKIVYHLQNTIGKAAEINRWKLTTIDTLVNEAAIPTNELHTMVDNLIENEELRTIVHHTLFPYNH
jgi:predicted transcriptional regulator